MGGGGRGREEERGGCSMSHGAAPWVGFDLFTAQCWGVPGAGPPSWTVRRWGTWRNLKNARSDMADGSRDER